MVVISSAGNFRGLHNALMLPWHCCLGIQGIIRQKILSIVVLYNGFQPRTTLVWYLYALSIVLLHYALKSKAMRSCLLLGRLLLFA